MLRDEHVKYWTKPFYFVLGPLPQYKKELAEMGLRYYPYRWMGIKYGAVIILDKFVPQIVHNMLEAGVPIVDPLPEETEEEALRHFWTDRLHEFALIAGRPGAELTHSIYRLNPPEMLMIPIVYSVYQETVNRMLAAGAPVLSQRPELPKS